LTIQLSAVEYQGNIYRFLSYTTAAKFDTYSDNFNQVFTSFDMVDDPTVLNIEPVILRLERVRQGGVFSDVIPANLPMGIEPLDVAILNQVELDDQISRGTILKIPTQ